MRVVGGECLRWQLGADSEALAWLPATPTAFLASTEDGTVAAFDARNGSGAQHVAGLLDRCLIRGSVASCHRCYCSCVQHASAGGSPDAAHV